MHFVHLKTSGFLRVLRTRDRIVRSNTWFIHSLLDAFFSHRLMLFVVCGVTVRVAWLRAASLRTKGSGWAAYLRHNASISR